MGHAGGGPPRRYRPARRPSRPRRRAPCPLPSSAVRRAGRRPGRVSPPRRRRVPCCVPVRVSFQTARRRHDRPPPPAAARSSELTPTAEAFPPAGGGGARPPGARGAPVFTTRPRVPPPHKSKLIPSPPPRVTSTSAVLGARTAATAVTAVLCVSARLPLDFRLSSTVLSGRRRRSPRHVYVPRVRTYRRRRRLPAARSGPPPPRLHIRLGCRARPSREGDGGGPGHLSILLLHFRRSAARFRKLVCVP